MKPIWLPAALIVVLIVVVRVRILVTAPLIVANASTLNLIDSRRRSVPARGNLAMTSVLQALAGIMQNGKRLVRGPHSESL